MLSVGEVAKRSGVPVSTVHFYETKGLIESIRNSGNQRRFSRDVLRRIAIIKAGQSVGIPLAVIGDALDRLPRSRPPTAKDWEIFSAGWREELNLRIERLHRLRDQLSKCIGCGCLSLESCPLFNPGDVLGSRRAGAHFLKD